MNAIAKALANTTRSYIAAKASVADTTEAILACGPSGILGERADLSKAPEQLRHFTNWTYACIRPIAQRIAGQPIRVGKIKKRLTSTKAKIGENVEPLDQHPLRDLLADPNDLMVAWSLIFSTVASLELTGRALWWLPQKEQILPIPISWLKGFEGTTSFQAFKVRPPRTGEAFLLPADECVYVSYPDPADPHGAVSPLSANAGAVTADEAVIDSQVSMFRRGIHPSHAIIVGKDPDQNRRPRLTASQQRQIIGAIRKRYEGVHRHGEPIILDGLIEDVKRLSSTPHEMDYLNSGGQIKSRIAQGFGTNPIIMGEIEGANRASSLAAEDQFCSYTLNPKIELLSQTLTSWLSPMFGGGLVVWIEPCQPRDAEMQLKKLSLAAQHGVLTAHELREFAGLPKDNHFTGMLVGGKNLSTTNPIEAGLRNMIFQGLAEIEADEMLAYARGGNAV